MKSAADAARRMIISLFISFFIKISVNYLLRLAPDEELLELEEPDDLEELLEELLELELERLEPAADLLEELLLEPAAERELLLELEAAAERELLLLDEELALLPEVRRLVVSLPAEVVVLILVSELPFEPTLVLVVV